MSFSHENSVFFSARLVLLLHPGVLLHCQLVLVCYVLSGYMAIEGDFVPFDHISESDRLVFFLETRVVCTFKPVESFLVSISAYPQVVSLCHLANLDDAWFLIAKVYRIIVALIRLAS